MTNTGAFEKSCNTFKLYTRLLEQHIWNLVVWGKVYPLNLMSPLMCCFFIFFCDCIIFRLKGGMNKGRTALFLVLSDFSVWDALRFLDMLWLFELRLIFYLLAFLTFSWNQRDWWHYISLISFFLKWCNNEIKQLVCSVPYWYAYQYGMDNIMLCIMLVKKDFDAHCFILTISFMTERNLKIKLTIC